MSFGINKRLSLKDGLALCLLFLVDFMEEGSESYHTSWYGYPSKFIPYSRTIKYWQKITGKKPKDTSTFYHLKQQNVFSKEAEKIKINFNSPWWREFLDYRFRFFTAPQKWNAKWIVIIYDIPEKNRFARDNFRQVIENIGFACWQRSVWLTINPVDRLISQLIEELNLGDFITVFTAQNMFDEKDLSMIKSLFKPQNFEKKYQRYITKANLAIKHKNKNKIKSMIDNFPNLIIDDSGLPGQFFTQPHIRQKVAAKYKQLLNTL